MSDKSKANECIEYLIQQLHQHPNSELLNILSTVVKSNGNLTDSSLVKVLELLKFLTKEDHLAIVMELLDRLCEEPLH